MTDKLKEKLSKIKRIVLDVDGVLTSGEIFISSLKLMVVPLVFFSLVSGVAQIENSKERLTIRRKLGKKYPKT